MNWLILLNSILCGLIALSLIFFSRKGAKHRPIASLLAYVITVAAGAVPIMHLLGRPYPAALPQLALNLLLFLALLSVRGNVVELFRLSNAVGESRLIRLLRRETWF